MLVVRCGDLAKLKQQWDTIIANHQEQVPNARFVHSATRDQTPLSVTDFQKLVQDLASHSRIKWFFYTDNSDGIALRLYDRPFKDAYPKQHFRESGNDKEWVILRGKDLGEHGAPCKQAMQEAFGDDNKWSPKDAPNPGRVTIDANTRNRLNFFEDQYHNNARDIDDGPGPGPGPSPDSPEGPSMKDLLEQFGQVILYGPPGTGKTREAKRVALSMLSDTVPQAETTSEVIEEQLERFREEKRYEIIVFHPAYEYEQFVGGIEPMITPAGQLVFHVRAGVFLRLCRAAEQNSLPTVLLIDEINRGNLPKLLGELVHALEYRAPHKVSLPFECEGRNHLAVPKKLYIIATMNSSDRSIGHIDVAIRRRFGLFHIGPNADVVRNAWQQIAGAETYGEQLARLMTDLNKRLGGEDLTAEVELGVGHSYFLPSPGSTRDSALQQVQMKWKCQVQPLLREYAQLLNLGPNFFQEFRDLLPAPKR